MFNHSQLQDFLEQVQLRKDFSAEIETQNAYRKRKVKAKIGTMKTIWRPQGQKCDSKKAVFFK